MRDDTRALYLKVKEKRCVFIVYNAVLTRKEKNSKILTINLQSRAQDQGGIDLYSVTF